MAQSLYFSLLVIALSSISECFRLNFICDNAVPSEKVVVTCESQTASLSCDQGTIKVLSANYGRTDRQTCSTGRPDDQLTNVQCSLSTSLSVVASRCDGKANCSIVAENAAFTDPCGGTYKYLTVSYECVAPPPPAPLEPSLAVVTCESQTAFLSCVQGVIKVLSANYGRTDSKTCSTGRPDNELSNVQCTQSTSLSVVASRCDGKISCSIVAENAAFMDPCGGTYKYLTVSYKCVAPPPPSPSPSPVPSEKAVVTCESQTASLSCDQGTIKVLSANYGRTDRQTCSTGRPDDQLTNVQCSLSTSLSVVASRCDGKTSCSFIAENAAFTDPCGGTYKYLTVSYKCVAPPPPPPPVPSEKAVVTCESQTAFLSCDQGTIKVLSANYGRTDRQTCSTGRPDNQLTNVQCSLSTSLNVVAIRCDGKTSCSIVAENAAFTDPCGGTYKYLTVSYECVAPPPPSPVVPSEKAVVTCESQTASLSCDQGTIKVLSANYGRTDRQTCSTGKPSNQISNVQCTQSTSLSVVATRCDEKTSCSIVAENAAFTDPCGGTYKYLTVSYECVAPPPPSPERL
ncbi:L-rhamnose-binding lectin CSL2 [Triplophysa tibetana]|uniref:L-rhamnose-binding lectin CSL2 n=1 Tax=Triplophysa tibetana TaxID=1572043 RepID=A0A5A9PHP0_9TELE|nr:L-rhamnose-binding lectin CSL2 [Triplophysa tibetana]